MTIEKTKPELKEDTIDLFKKTPEPGYRGRPGDKKIVSRNGSFVKERTRAEYDRLWKRFEKHHAREYCEKMGYSLQDIERIGRDKFIDAHDWRKVTDIEKWKTDMINIVICAHCNSEFTTYQIDTAICGNCKKHYDMVRFAEFCEANEKDSPGISPGIRTAFVFNDVFREKFLKQ